jgi:hypothetical protein
METVELVGMHAVIVLTAFIAAVTIGTFVIWFWDHRDESTAGREVDYTRRLLAEDFKITPRIDEISESPGFGPPRPAVVCMPGRTTPRKHFRGVCRGWPAHKPEQAGS